MPDTVIIDMPLQDPTTYVGQLVDLHRGLINDELLLEYLDQMIDDTRSLKNARMKLALTPQQLEQYPIFNDMTMGER